MPRQLTLAAIRMDAAPAPVASRLERAEGLVSRAAQQGAQLASLPELFNTGYEYSQQNYQLAESLDGKTVQWMKHTARTHHIYVTGSFLLRELDGIYNTMLVVAPEGKAWRYDKSHPWAWERAYFRPRKTPIQPAETELGKIGMLICADVVRTHLWAQYAGKVDLMLANSCPPRFYQFDFHLPGNRVVSSKELGFLLKTAYRDMEKAFGEFFLNQARWLGVPSVNTTGAGLFRSGLPRPKMSLAILFSLRPDLWKFISRAGEVTVSAEYFDETFVADANGNKLAQTNLNADDLVVSTVQLADSTPHPQVSQPAYGINPLAYPLDDSSNALMAAYYNQHWQDR